ncbi:S-layer homology domain-containing protein [Ructibacterium gallinarum]|uniref:S-layer homology domain-containing protein n=1 Tax=Ructibacterium gallinarum TaxID=2779355 RepID=A0A9D5LXB9_9FIRM|nr:S-layer homology domain-containing protein [Ructibacterium gallinarum]MBE5039571.1 S-layer homology domain-containing protein [Ructibacterium gallinarum]
MRKVVSFILAVLLIIGALPVLAQTAEGVQDISNELNLLSALEIVESIDVNVLDNHISREEFAYYIAKMSGISGSDTVRYFIDVSADDYAFAYINGLVENKIISESDDKYFRPNDPITQDEAVKMVISALGYTTDARVRGGFPTGYRQIASRLEVWDQFGDMFLTYRDGFCMIFNTLKTHVCSLQSIGTSGDQVSAQYVESDETLLEVVFDIVYAKGMVRTTYGGSVDSADQVEANQVRIDTEIYELPEGIDAEEYLGNYVEYFFQDTQTRYNTLVCMYPAKTAKEDLVINIDDFDRLDGTKLYYWSSDRLRNLDFQNNLIVYNGSLLTDNVKEFFENLNKGTITIKDGNGDGAYDYVFVKNYRNFYINAININQIYNELEPSDVIDLDQIENLLIYNSGESVTASDLLRDSLLSVASSADNTIVEIIINSEIVTGVLDSKNDSEVTIDGTTYKIERSYQDAFESKTIVGGNYSYIIDHLGNIAYVFQADARRMTLGYIIDMVSNNDPFDAKPIFKILSSDNEIFTATVANNLTIDSIRYRDPSVQAVENALINSGSLSQLIQYELDSNGNLKDIDTLYVGPDEDPEYSLSRVFETVESRWYHSGRYGFVALCSGTETTTFCIPEDGNTDETNYYTRKGAVTESTDTAATLDAYYASSESGYVDAIILERDVNLSEPETALMLEEVAQTINEEGEVLYKLSGYSNGSFVEHTLDSDVDTKDLQNSRKGDLLVIYQNDNGKINMVKKVFDGQSDGNGTIGWECETDTRKLLVEGMTTTAGVDVKHAAVLNLSFGYVMKNYDGIIAISKDMIAPVGERIIVEGKMCPMYDKKTDTIELVDYSAILGYNDVGSECTRLIHQTWYDGDRGVYLYN